MPITNVKKPEKTYIKRTADERLLKQLTERNAYIEIIGAARSGKTSLVQQVIYRHQHGSLQSYDMIGWIDCKSSSTAYKDIIALTTQLGYASTDSQAAESNLVDYCKQHPNYLLVLDNVDQLLGDSLPFLNAAFIDLQGQLVYTAAHSPQYAMSKVLGVELTIAPIILTRFDTQEVKQLVAEWITGEGLDSCDFDFLSDLSGGQPDITRALCQHYQNSHYQTLDTFLKDLANKVSTRSPLDLDQLVTEIINKDMPWLEQPSSSDPEIAQSRDIIKQAIYLGDQPIPLAFFSVGHSLVDDSLIGQLCRQSAILIVDKREKTLRVVPAFRYYLAEKFKHEETQWFSKNVERLSELFNYLTMNETPEGLDRKPEALRPYADLVRNLFDWNGPSILPKGSPLLPQLLILGSSLARFYYLAYGQLSLADNYLDTVIIYCNDSLPDSLIDAFQNEPSSNVPLPQVCEKQKALLSWYASEYLYQRATIRSQLLERGEDNSAIVKDFQHAYAIQKNLGVSNPNQLAYTVRNLTRALRKTGDPQEIHRWYETLKDLVQHHIVHPIVKEDLLIDQGIMQKEEEDQQPKEKRQYGTAISTLKQAEALYEPLNQDKKYNRQLTLISRHLGRAYLMDQQFEEGIKYIYRVFQYIRQSDAQQKARTYLELAKAFHEQEYQALACLYAKIAYPLQYGGYKASTKKLFTKITTSLDRSLPPSTLPPLGPDECEALLLSITNQQSNTLLLDQIDAYNISHHVWLSQQPTNELEADPMQSATPHLPPLKINHSTKEQREQKDWYRRLAQQINLTDSQHKQTYQFSKELEIALLKELQLLRNMALYQTTRMTKKEKRLKLLKVLANLVPEIGTSIGPITLNIGFAPALKDIMEVLEECHDRDKRVRAEEALKKYPGLEKGIGFIQQEMQEIACYVARCYDPLLSGQLVWLNLADIKILATRGAKRIINYDYPKVFNISDPNELAMLALRHAKKDSMKIGSPNMRVEAFFEKPEVRLMQSVPTATQHTASNRYGFRWGAPAEVKQIQDAQLIDSAARQNSFKVDRLCCRMM